MTLADNINPATGTPHEVSLGDVLGKIRLSPAHASAFLHNLAADHFGGPNDELGRQLVKAANETADPATYGNAQQSGVAAQQNWGAAQGQSDIAATGSMTEPSWMRDARASGWNDPNADRPPTTAQSSSNEPPWMQQARQAGWTGNDPATPARASNPEPEPDWQRQARAAGWNPDATDANRKSQSDESRKPDVAPPPGSPSASTAPPDFSKIKL